MTRAKKVLVVLIVATLGIWGCAQGQSPHGSLSQAERIKALEAKSAKFEDDYRAAAATLNQVRRKVADSEEQNKQLQSEKDSVEQQVQTLTQERDALVKQRQQLQEHSEELTKQCDQLQQQGTDLRQQLASRTSERDTLLTQYEAFRKQLRELLGQAEAVLPTQGDHPGTSAAAGVSTGKAALQ